MVGGGAGGRQRDQVGDLGLVRVATTHSTPGMDGQFFGRALGVAAGDQDARRGILAMHPADGLAHVVVGRRR